MRTNKHGVRQQKGKPQRVRAAQRSVEREAGAPSLGDQEHSEGGGDKEASRSLESAQLWGRGGPEGCFMGLIGRKRVEWCGRHNNGPQKQPCPTPWNLCVHYFSWQRQLCRCDEVTDFEMGRLSG